MTDKKIAGIIEKYYEGTSTVEEEELLYEYFSGTEISPSLLPHVDEFRSISAFRAKQHNLRADLSFKLPVKRFVFARRNQFIQKAAIVIGLLIAGYMAGLYRSEAASSPQGFDFTQLSLSELPSERIECLKNFKQRPGYGLSRPDLSLLTLLLKYDPDENVRLEVLRLLNENISADDVQAVIADALRYQTSELVLHNLLDIILDNDLKKAAEPLFSLILENSYSDNLKERIKAAAIKTKLIS